MKTPAGTAAIEENLVQFFRDLGAALPDTEVRDTRELFSAFTDVPFPVFNSQLRAHVKADKVDEVIASVQARATERGVPALWWIGPGNEPVTLSDDLERHGFKKISSPLGMTADLQAIPVLGSRESLGIERVGDRHTAAIYCELLCKGFGMPEFVAAIFLEFLYSVGLDERSPLQNYLAFWDGEPAATASLFTGAGVAGIYNVTTLPEMRRRGIGRGITLFALHHARARGLNEAILQSSAAGVEVYKSLGFRERCRFEQYVWQPQR